MKSEPKLSKQLAAVLQRAYRRALDAREAVEHRMKSIPKQEHVVWLWREQLEKMILENYPGYEPDSYPVATRRSREIAKLNRYQEELPERLAQYADSLKAIEQITVDVRKAVNRSPSRDRFTTPWPRIPAELREPWPSSWPARGQYERHDERSAEDAAPAFFLEPAPKRGLANPPRPTTFVLDLAGCSVSLEARYPEGVASFEIALFDFLESRISSRWRAIEEVQRIGIRWPQLDRYLAECPHPWLPDEFVDEEFGLRGTLKYRDAMADLMATLSVEAGNLYFQLQPWRFRLSSQNISRDALGELVHAGLVRWGGHLEPTELVEEIPFAEWKSAFTLTGLPSPKSFENVRARFQELVSRRGAGAVRDWMRGFVDPSDVFEMVEPPGYSCEDRLGIRARANVLVSTLVLLGEGRSEPLRILDWD